MQPGGGGNEVHVGSIPPCFLNCHLAPRYFFPITHFESPQHQVRPQNASLSQPVGQITSARFLVLLHRVALGCRTKAVPSAAVPSERGFVTVPSTPRFPVVFQRFRRLLRSNNFASASSRRRAINPRRLLHRRKIRQSPSVTAYLLQHTPGHSAFTSMPTRSSILICCLLIPLYTSGCSPTTAITRPCIAIFRQARQPSLP